MHSVRISFSCLTILRNYYLMYAIVSVFAPSIGPAEWVIGLILHNRKLKSMWFCSNQARRKRKEKRAKWESIRPTYLLFLNWPNFQFHWKLAHTHQRRGAKHNGKHNLQDEKQGGMNANSGQINIFRFFLWFNMLANTMCCQHNADSRQHRRQQSGWSAFYAYYF